MKYCVYLLSYNNYYNRQVKKLSSIQDYINGGYQIGQTIPDVNFEYGDGINSKILVNQGFVTKQPDYILIEDKSTRTVNLDNSINYGTFSRWFIIDSNLVRGNQYEFTLKRDICVDYNDLLLNSTYFIERGYVPDTSDLIFNDEGQKYSQIKKEQTPLYDETGVPWIVGYMPKKLNISSDTEVKSYVRPETADFVVNGIANWDYYQYVTDNPSHTSLYSDNVSDAYRFVVTLPVQSITNQNTIYQVLKMGYSATNKSTYGGDVADTASLFPNTYTTQESGLIYRSVSGQSNFDTEASDYGWYNTNHTNIASYINVLNRTVFYKQPGQMTGTSYNQMIQAFKDVYGIDNNAVNFVENNLNGKTIKDTSTGKLYKITLNDRIVDKISTGPTGSSSAMATLRTKIRNVLSLTVGTAYTPTDYGYTTHLTTDTSNVYAISPIFKLKVIQIVLTEAASTRTYVPKDDSSDATPVIYRNHCVDQMYDMFAIPYGDLDIKNGGTTITANKDVGLSIAQQIATRFDSFIYDLQLLPYCPCREYIQSDGTFDITTAGDTKARPIYYGDNSLQALNYVFYCSSSKIDNINLLHKVDNNWIPYSIQVNDIKKSYNTEMYRLSSPNFASSFEFSPAQNGGVSSFIVSATYKPYNPYIRVRPQFNRLFGQDFKDGRGLILQGDFSLATMTDAWIQYELQNKNYLNAFNREITSMRLQQDVERQNQLASVITGSLQGTVAGGAAGGMAGGPWGAVAGAAVGAVSSIGTGILDYQNSERLRNDTINKAKTLFNYNLENIKALPNTIRNVGALTIDNVLVPVLEYYCASDDEIDTFEKKMQYYGMSVMKAGQLLEYINPLQDTFVQGYLLRLLPPEGIAEEADNHLAEEISNEVQKGLYIMV